MRFETAHIRSMLGLRFRDATTERPVTDGLQVSIRRGDGLGGVQTAVRTVSGAYVAQGLPGLRGYERDGESVADGAVSFGVAVRDKRDRYVPVELRVALPYTPQEEHSGLYPIVETPSDAEAETPEPTCYLFSGVRRPVAPGQAAIYADLVTDAPDGSLVPASHAVLEVKNTASEPSSENNVWFGIADERGRAVVQFPTPAIQMEELQDPLPPSGDGGPGNGGPGNGGPGIGNGTDGHVGGKPLSTRSWPLAIRVRYEPSALDRFRGDGRPFLSTVLQQGQGRLYSDATTNEEELSTTLSYGRPLTLRTTGLPDVRMALKIDPNGEIT